MVPIVDSQLCFPLYSASETGPSPKPTIVPSSYPTDIGTADKAFVLNQNFGELEGEAASWILTTDSWTLPAAAPPEMYIERYILAMLYFNTDTLGWLNEAGWLSSSLSVCEWAGIVCNRDMRVQEIDLGESFRHVLFCGVLSLRTQLLLPSP